MVTAADLRTTSTYAVPHHPIGPGDVAECFVIPHPTDARVLLMPGADGWMLPGQSVNVGGRALEMSHWHTGEPVAADLLALDVPVLRCLRTGIDTPPPDWIPPAGTGAGVTKP